jgi:hypothetical protein
MYLRLKGFEHFGVQELSFEGLRMGISRRLQVSMFKRLSYICNITLWARSQYIWFKYGIQKLRMFHFIIIVIHAFHNVATEMAEQCGSGRVARGTWLFSVLLSMFFIGIYLWHPSLCKLSLVSLILHSSRKEQVFTRPACLASTWPRRKV